MVSIIYNVFLTLFSNYIFRKNVNSELIEIKFSDELVNPQTVLSDYIDDFEKTTYHEKNFEREFFEPVYEDRSIEHDGWHLPGTKKEHDWCGEWQTLGCPNAHKHKHQYSGLTFIRNFQRSCFRSECKICSKKWAIRQANNASKRIKQYGKGSKRKPNFVTLKISHSDSKLEFDELKDKAIEVLRSLGTIGGSIIYSPFTFDEKTRSWYYDPKFHVVCFGRIIHIRDTQSKFGWKVVSHVKVDDVFVTYLELLRNCGLRKGNRSTTWYGSLSYCKVNVPKHAKNGRKCPICSSKLVLVYYALPKNPIPPDKTFEGYLDSYGWCPVGTELKIPLFRRLKFIIMKYLVSIFIQKNGYLIQFQ